MKKLVKLQCVLIALIDSWNPKKKLSSLLRKHKGEEGGGQPNAYSKAPIIRTKTENGKRKPYVIIMGSSWQMLTYDDKGVFFDFDDFCLRDTWI